MSVKAGILAVNFFIKEVVNVVWDFVSLISALEIISIFV